MNVGDLKYTFTDKDNIERTITIPSDVLKAARRDKIPNKVAIDRYLADLGYLDETVVEETAKAKAPKTRTRKPNNTKRAIVDQLAKCMTAAYGVVEITNPERQFRFEIDGQTYEVTLVQKRKQILDRRGCVHLRRELAVCGGLFFINLRAEKRHSL